MATKSKATKKPAKKKAAARKTRKAPSAAAAEGQGGTGTLVVVESPAKAKTIKKYLGSGFTVKASVGHVLDLPKSKIGIDIEDDFKPTYEVIKGKQKVLAEIKAAAKNSARVLLATDPDREGEAIAWHIADQIKRTKVPTQRVLFNEITKKAIQEAIQHPHELDANKYDAQQACSTGWSVIKSRPSSGRRCGAGSPPGACRAWRCGWWWSARARSPPSSPRSIGPSKRTSAPRCRRSSARG